MFGNHKYAFALHGPKDSAIDKRTKEPKATEHVHIHAMIVMRGYDRKKLNPNINDLHLWRQRMAHHARGYGINDDLLLAVELDRDIDHFNDTFLYPLIDRLSKLKDM